MYLRSATVALVGLIEQDVAVLVEDPLRLGARENDLEELVVEPRCLECQLPVVIVNIEQASLGAGGRRGFGFVDRCCDTVNMQDPGKRQPAEPRTNDRHL